MNIDRFQLHNTPYEAPQFIYGDVGMDERRGEVTIVGRTDAPIPWPVGKRGRVKAIILFDALADAVRTDSNQAVAHWGVNGQTVTKWRNALEVKDTAGTSRLRSEYSRGEVGAKNRAIAHEKSRDAEVDAERRAKIAAARKPWARRNSERGAKLQGEREKASGLPFAARSQIDATAISLVRPVIATDARSDASIG